jgi:iron complex transport system substrate-binding protein
VLPPPRRGWVSAESRRRLLPTKPVCSIRLPISASPPAASPWLAIVQLKPDFLLVAEAGNRAEDDGRAFVLHPALARFYPPDKRIVLPERLTVCGGVMLADALDVLTAELKRVAR